MLSNQRFPNSNEDDSLEESEENPSYGVGIGGWIIVAFLTLVLAVVIRVFLVQSYRIPSESMFPTLEVGDHILVNKLGYGYDLLGNGISVLKFFDPQRYDVVVFEHKDESSRGSGLPESFIKRVVGLPGETIVIRNDRVYVNGRKLREIHPVVTGREGSLTPDLIKSNYGPIILGNNEYFVLGDNRVNSEDSRFFGPIMRNKIEGKAILIYWSWEEDGLSSVRWQRIAKLIK